MAELNLAGNSIGDEGAKALAAAVAAPRKRKRDQVEEENFAVAISKSMME